MQPIPEALWPPKKEYVIKEEDLERGRKRRAAEDKKHELELKRELELPFDE